MDVGSFLKSAVSSDMFDNFEAPDILSDKLSALKDLTSNGRTMAPNDLNINNTKHQFDNGFVLDRDWVRSSFMISDSYIDDRVDRKNRYYSSAARKFTDTKLGGNIGINAKPQYTRYSDIRVKGRLAGRNEVNVGAYDGNFGMGRYYSEAIDDNSRTIYLRFGVPQFNSLSNFIANFYNHERSLLARTGRLPGAAYIAGQVTGLVAGFIFLPVITTALVIGHFVDAYLGTANSKFYYLKPAMHSYWSTVNLLVNTIAVNKGILPRAMMKQYGGVNDMGKPDPSIMAQLSSFMPDEFTDTGYDIYAVANRAQRIANQVYKQEYESFAGDLSAIESPIQPPRGKPSILDAISNYLGKEDYQPKQKDQKGDEIEPGMFIDQSTGLKKEKNAGFVAMLDAEFKDGSSFVTLKVDHSGSIGESFSNSVTESELANKLNSVSSTVREARFSFANGNLTDGPISDLVKGALGAVADFGMGALDTVGLDGLAALAGNAFVDIPKHWQSSTANLPRANYSMTLISPYGNPISQMQNIFIPLSCLLAGALPLSAGAQAYTSPFLVQIWDRGRTQIQLGIIDSLSINRGVSNLSFNNVGQPMAVEVSFSIIDLSSLMHMPIPIMGTLGSATNKAIWNEDNPLTDYMAVLAAQDIYSQVYDLPKAKLRLAKTIATRAYLTSPAHWASLIHEETTTGLVNRMFLGIPNFVSNTYSMGQNVQTQDQLRQ